jgi:hypothetical protein
MSDHDFAAAGGEMPQPAHSRRGPAISGLTSSLSEAFPLIGGTGAFAGTTGTGLAVSTSEAPTANADLAITLHRR